MSESQSKQRASWKSTPQMKYFKRAKSHVKKSWTITISEMQGKMPCKGELTTIVILKGISLNA